VPKFAWQIFGTLVAIYSAVFCILKIRLANFYDEKESGGKK
jgi:hypothetical protein